MNKAMAFCFVLLVRPAVRRARARVDAMECTSFYMKNSTHQGCGIRARLGRYENWELG